MKLANTVIAGVAALGVAGVASAVGQSYDIAVDVNSWDGFGSINNESIVVDLAALGIAEEDWVLTGIGWNVDITPVGLSWYSEVTLDLGGPDQLTLSPGAADGFAGDGIPVNYSSDTVKFSDLGFVDIAVPSGVYSIEVFEGFDDVADAIDASMSGTLTLQFVPAPGAIALLGLAGLVSRRRRR